VTNIETLIQNQKQFFLKSTFDYEFRIEQLDKLKSMLRHHEEAIYDALRKDLNKSSFETLTTELGVLFSEIDHARRNLKDWMKPRRVKAPITHKGTRNYVYKEAYGATLVISAWNYPLQLALAPAIGAMAAGNTVVIKPSEFAPNTSTLVATMIEKTFPEQYITVIEGAAQVSESLLEQSFDSIFFTGGANIAKIVMEKASRQLIPVTLELGGKSPAIVHDDANIKLAARRIAWGKFTNAGQTCVAPDFIYVHDRVKTKFMRALIRQIKRLYGKHPLQNDDFVRMIHQDHFKRIERLMQDGNIVYGGGTDPEKLRIEPTLIDQVTWEDSIMQEEIFGPLLPVLPYYDLDEVLWRLQQMEKPLALYYFGENDADQEKVMTGVSFGGGAVNDTLYHLANPHLPFGGVGHSGMGAYHGKYSFDTFTHEKAVMKQSTKFDIPFRYPGGKLTGSIVKKFMGR
jgi:aldehyde dehydrogenase (NAD+)